MPQLDIGIFVLEIFLNFLFFWCLYLYKAQNIFPYIMKIIKFRICNMKLFNIKLWYFLFKLSVIIKVKQLLNNKFNYIIINILLNYIIIYNKIKLVHIKNSYLIIYKILYNLLNTLHINYMNNRLIKINI